MGFMYINKTNLWGSGSAASANLNCICLHFTHTHTGTHLSLTSWIRRMFEKRVFLSMLIRVSFKSLDSIKCSVSTRRERRYDISDVITSNMLCTQRKETHKYYIKMFEFFSTFTVIIFCIVLHKIVIMLHFMSHLTPKLKIYIYIIIFLHKENNTTLFKFHIILF